MANWDDNWLLCRADERTPAQTIYIKISSVFYSIVCIEIERTLKILVEELTDCGNKFF